MGKFVDLKGKTYNSWYVEKFAEMIPGKKQNIAYWWCICILCKKRKKVRGSNLTSNKSKSCGCVRKHGKVDTPEYKVWTNTLKNRCSEWNDFLIFLKDMGEKPSPKHYLQRLDKNKPFSKKNCIWTNVLIKGNLIEVNGHCMNIKDWSKFLGISRQGIYYRIAQGWPLEEVFS